jgi:hypothetical protein
VTGNELNPSPRQSDAMFDPDKKYRFIDSTDTLIRDAWRGPLAATESVMFNRAATYCGRRGNGAARPESVRSGLHNHYPPERAAASLPTGLAMTHQCGRAVMCPVAASPIGANRADGRERS